MNRDSAIDLEIAPELFRAMKYRNFAYGLFLAASLLASWGTVGALVQLVLHHDACSQIVVIPFVSAALVYWKRKTIFQNVTSHFGVATFILVFGLATHVLARLLSAKLSPYDSISLNALALVLVWIAGFCAAYGMSALRAAAFPLAFLLLTVPIPSYALDKSIFFLQSGSTAISKFLFTLAGVPVYRQGFLLYLPGLTIEVAKECSSIRSSLALVITCLLGGYYYLHSGWKRTVLILLALPLSVIKNGVRIVTLSLLSIYVNPAFMRGNLHHEGGILFYLLALLILYLPFRWLERSESRDPKVREEAT